MNQDPKARRRRAAKECALNRGGNKEQKRSLYHCNYCQKDISSTPRIKCAVCPDFDLCLECFSVGVEIVPHKSTHDYRVVDDLSFPIFHPDWGADEEMLLLEAIDQYGLGNWQAVAEHVGPTTTPAQCKEHYFMVYIDTPSCPLPTALPAMALYEQQKAEEARLKAEAAAAQAEAAAQQPASPAAAAEPAQAQQQAETSAVLPSTAPTAEADATAPGALDAPHASPAVAAAAATTSPANPSGAPATHASSPPSRKRKLTGAAAAAAARAQARREAEAAAAAAAAAEAAAQAAPEQAPMEASTAPTGEAAQTVKVELREGMEPQQPADSEAGVPGSQHAAPEQGTSAVTAGEAAPGAAGSAQGAAQQEETSAAGTGAAAGMARVGGAKEDGTAAAAAAAAAAASKETVLKQEAAAKTEETAQTALAAMDVDAKVQAVMTAADIKSGGVSSASVAPAAVTDTGKEQPASTADALILQPPDEAGHAATPQPSTNTETHQQQGAGVVTPVKATTQQPAGATKKGATTAGATTESVTTEGAQPAATGAAGSVAEVKVEAGSTAGEPDVVASPAGTLNVPHLSGSQQVLAMSQKKLHRSQTAEQDAAAATMDATGTTTGCPPTHPSHVEAGALSLHHEHPETGGKRPHTATPAEQEAATAAAAATPPAAATPGPSAVASKAGKAAGGKAAAAAAAAGKDAGAAGRAGTPAPATAAGGTGMSLKEPKPVQVQGDYAMGYHAKRHEFDPEYDNDAECIIADMEFTEQDTEEDKQLKLSILAIYNKRLDERERRRNFLRDYGLLSMRKVQALERRRSQAERDTHARLRVFARYSTPAAHDELVEGLLLEQRLRARIQELKAYRRLGVRTLDEADQFESEQRKKQKQGVSTPSMDGGWEGSIVNLSLVTSAGAMLNLNQQQMAALSAAAAKDTGAASAATAPPAGGNKNASSSLSAWRAHRGVPLDVTCLPGVEALTARERELCSSARLLPVHYLALKDMMLRDCDKHGMMPRSEARTFFRLDQHRCLRLYDLWVSCGWITGDKATAQLNALRAAAAQDGDAAMQDTVTVKVEPEATAHAGTPSISYDQQPSSIGHAAPQDDGRTPVDVS